MLDYESNQPCGITLEMLEGVASLKEFVTLSSKPTSKSGFAQRKYPHTPEQIAKELRVDEKGKLWWRYTKGRTRRLGFPVGSLDSAGYLQTNLNYYSYKIHILAFCLYYGRWPEPGKVIDHINFNKTDNRKENLKEVSFYQNSQKRKGPNSNTSSGIRGVSWNKNESKWEVVLTVNNRRIYGGKYSTLEDATHVRKQLENKYSIEGCAVSVDYSSPKLKTLDSISTFQQVKL